ncbi:arginine--tRNA ligase, partial [candidate division TA06 bacterium]|nr:arginine--tRNA ligase [candidate division TA06 bacterium]
MTLREKIEKSLVEALQRMGLPLDSKVEVVEAKDPSYGDYASNVAFLLSKVLKSSPVKVAERVLSNLEIEPGLFDKVEVASPGFINFTLSWKALQDELIKIIKRGDTYGKSDRGKKEKVLVEFVSANPTGPLVVANARAAAIGDSLVRLFNFLGYEAKSDFYVDDGGNQVELLGRSLETRFREHLGEKVTFPKDGYRG